YLNAAMSEKAVKESLVPFRLLVRKIRYGKVYVTSEPSGAELFINGKSEGLTHGELVVSDVRPGQVDILLVLDGYKPLSKRCHLEEGATLEVHLELQKNQSVVWGRPWENSLGMKIEPLAGISLGNTVMAAAWETRVQDYQTYCKEKRVEAPKLPPFKQAPNHPVVNVSRDDAMKFCDWLTERERKLERISLTHRYRLPTDAEWSQLVGLLDEDPKLSPSAKDAQKQAVFPWGDDWIESNKPGNFADMTAALSPNVDVDRTIAGYDDGHAYTAPVGSYEPNSLKLHDLSGNVQEWVSDPYSNQAGNTFGVLRGGGWNSYRIEDLYSGSRNAALPTFADVMYGFRVVLAKELAPAGE
ncbi:MAG TPA: SUMF1/EgtB/PvdO family nonheme iron enzyme, partial [Luteolibacter sp.]|nr:SUMF1/EgtB/PvdO family nonheme iron enzyme [Luteolibacter sp.]